VLCIRLVRGVPVPVPGEKPRFDLSELVVSEDKGSR
jgi:hypothetical protein